MKRNDNKEKLPDGSNISNFDSVPRSFAEALAILALLVAIAGLVTSICVSISVKYLLTYLV